MTDGGPTGDAGGTIDWTGDGDPARGPADQGADGPTSGATPGGESAGDAISDPESGPGPENVGADAAGPLPGPGPGAAVGGDDPATTGPGAADDAPTGRAQTGAHDGPEPGADDGSDDDVATDVGDDGVARSVEAERDEYLDRLQRLQAEFENYRRRVNREQAEARERGAEALAAELLPVLDGCEAAIQQGADDVEPVRAQLTELLAKAGLEREGAPGEPFDPERHEAVMHEPADESGGDGEIAEVLRIGYCWKGRVLRPAMVKVRG